MASKSMTEYRTHSSITIVSGLPRSGTSMMMQMLAAGGLPVLADDIRKPDPDNPRGYFEFEPARRTATDSRWVADAVGKAVKLVHLLVPHLPGGYSYRVIFMHRDMQEVLASQQAMLHRLGRREVDLAPARLAEVFASQLQRVRHWMAAQPHFCVADFDYRLIVEDPLAQSRNLNQFLGGRLDETLMAAAVNPALYRKRRGVLG